jgi:hypothetical protein
MTLARTQYYKRCRLGVGVFRRAAETVLQRVGLNPIDAVFTVSETLPDKTEIKRNATIVELDTVCDIGASTVTFTTGFSDAINLTIVITPMPTRTEEFGLRVQTQSPDALNDVFAAFSETLKLEAAPEGGLDSNVKNLTSLSESLGPMLTRIEALEDAVLSDARWLRCFLSYRFHAEDELTALRVQQFLALLNVLVLSGANYEPRQVSEKVLSKLTQPLDFIVLLVTGNGESMWTRDEIGTAIHKGMALIPLIERGADFDPGLFADIEYIEFDKGHIGDAFLKLAQAVKFIREQKSRSRNEPEAVS